MQTQTQGGSNSSSQFLATLGEVNSSSDITKQGRDPIYQKLFRDKNFRQIKHLDTETDAFLSDEVVIAILAAL